VGWSRHRRLINWLSLAVALQLAVALVVMAGRAGRDNIGTSARTEQSADKPQRGSILEGSRFSKRRGSSAARARTTPSSTATTAPVTGVAPAPAVKRPAAATDRQGRSRETSTTPETTPEAVAPGTAAAAGTASLPGDDGQSGTLADPVGDTFVDGTKKPFNDSRADIVHAAAGYGPGGIAFGMQVQRPTDPRDDERWAADSTYAQWSVDTNGDSAPDYEVQYFLVDEENLGGNVSRPGKGGEVVCEVGAAAHRADGYRFTLDPACLGNPASFSWRATIFYDTNPPEDDSVVVSDMAPDGGWSFPVTRPS
jgi:hypothetical protein